MQKAENRGQSTALTSGSIKKQLVLFSIPIFLELYYNNFTMLLMQLLRGVW